MKSKLNHSWLIRKDALKVYRPNYRITISVGQMQSSLNGSTKLGHIATRIFGTTESSREWTAVNVNDFFLRNSMGKIREILLFGASTDESVARREDSNDYGVDQGRGCINLHARLNYSKIAPCNAASQGSGSWKSSARHGIKLCRCAALLQQPLWKYSGCVWHRTL